MKNMTKVLTAVALSSSLFFSTLGESASASYFSGTFPFVKGEHVTYMFVKSDSGATKEIEVTGKGNIYVFFQKGHNVDARKANFNLVLSNNKRLKIKKGVIYSKGKLYNGTVTTKKVTKKNIYNASKKEEFQLTMTVKDGKVIKGKEYKKLWIEDGVTPG